MTNLAARAKAIELLVACFNSEEAGGFEGCGLDDADWLDGVELHDQKTTSFVVRVGGHNITFRATVENPS